jgi:hypothetical protein
VECRALHHLERSVDWKLWGRELRGLRVRPFFLLMSPARHWLPAQLVPLGTFCIARVLSCGRRRLEENRNACRTAFPDRSPKPCRALALQRDFTTT